MSFERQVVVVTGAGSGIGAALVRALARRGAKVIASDLDGAAAARVAEETGAEAARVNVTRPNEVGELVRDVATRHGRLDCFVNNAGIGVGGELHELTDDDWRRVLDVNLFGVLNGVRAAYAQMRAQGHGHLVNVASIAGLVPYALALPYTTSKHTVVGLSLALRAEAADHGVKVSVVCPGAIENPDLDPQPAARRWRPRARAPVGAQELDQRRRLRREGARRGGAQPGGHFHHPRGVGALAPAPAQPRALARPPPLGGEQAEGSAPSDRGE